MKQIVCIVLLPILVSGCLQFQPRKTYSPRYGVEYNRMRDSLDIVLLDSSWVPFNISEEATVWGHKVRYINNVHGFKNVAYFNDTLYCELDTYGNGESYETVDGRSCVGLDVMYFYRPVRIGPWRDFAFEQDSVGWICCITDSLGEQRPISKVQADSIIEAWRTKK